MLHKLLLPERLKILQVRLLVLQLRMYVRTNLAF